MYVVTFYSFKGGTGRTMTLVNVGVELAKRGKRVLMVDFDLEAPGLDTFRLSRPRTETPGVVDYIAEYCATSITPNVTGFVYRSTVDIPGPGELWIMPAGLQDENYDSKFKSLDWQKLYEEQEGFLMFEDLKAQWQIELNADYVLVDSRTGHTDIGGICTRQLPDAVVIMFLPNEQNRRGLESIVEQIRHEHLGDETAKIALHFVAANVPALDDEEEILASNMQRMQATLKYEALSGTINHLNSFALMNQSIFSLDRPKSGLAEQYRALTNNIVTRNLEDVQGAVSFLDSTVAMVRERTLLSKKIEDDLKTVRLKHPNDIEVLRRLGRIRRLQRKSEDALALLDQALSLRENDSELLVSRAELYAQLRNSVGALTDLHRLLQMPDLSPFDLALVIRLYRQLSAELPGELSSAPALSNPALDVDLARELEMDVRTLPVAERILRGWISEGHTFANVELVLTLIGQGQFRKAMETIASSAPVPVIQMAEYEIFNYAMAEWGETGELSRPYMERVLMLASQRKLENPNYLQCVALAQWAVGSITDALITLHKAGASMEASPEQNFSCWSYLCVSAERFMIDLDEMRELFHGRRTVPEFMVRASASLFNKPSSEGVN